jgi:hypothetical protein
VRAWPPQVQGKASPRGRYRHLVHVSDCDEERAQAAADFVGPSFGDGGTAFVVASPSHRDAIAAELTNRGFDLGGARTAGTYVGLDAADLLSKIISAGSPDSTAFDNVVGGPIRRACREGRPVYACGEAVDLLFAAGQPSTALLLERLWSDLADRHKFSLYCSYSLTNIARQGGLTAAKEICDAHTAVVTPSSYARAMAEPTGPDNERRRSTFLFPVALAPRAARGFVTDTLNGWGASEFVEPAALIASELSTNALVHTRSPFELSVSREDARLRVSVRDASPALPTRVRSSPRRTGGRGLPIVASVARTWGIDALDDGKVIWAEL